MQVVLYLFSLNTPLLLAFHRRKVTVAMCIFTSYEMRKGVKKEFKHVSLILPNNHGHSLLLLLHN